MQERSIEYSFHDEHSQQSVYEQIADRAENLLGSPSHKYRGAESGLGPEEGFDCSGFVTYILQQTGVSLPDGIRHCNEYFDSFGVLIHPSLHRRGDLIFFSYNHGRSPTHMGIVTDEDHYIHAPGKENTVVSLTRIQEKVIRNPAENQQYIYNPIGFKRITETTGRWRVPLAQQVFPEAT